MKNENILADSSNNPAGKTTETAKEKLSKFRQSTSSVSSGKVAGRKLPAVSQAEKDLQKAQEILFSPENFEAIVSMPANIAMAITSDPIFNLKDKEVKTMSITASTAAKFYGTVDPKSMALTMFVISFLTSYGTRTALYFNKKRKQKKKPIEHKKDGE